MAHPVEEKQTSWRLWGGLLLLAMVGGALYAFVAGGADEVSHRERVQVSEEPRVAIDLVREPSLEIEADPPPEPPPEPEAESELEPESEPEPEESSEPAVEPRVSRMSSMNATPFAVDEEELARDPGF